MTNALVIVESPAKAKTIQKYLGKGYVVMASKGHIRDLPKSGLQVDVEHGYTPSYEVLEDHKALVTELRRAAKEAETIYLAPDPDREGEAIAWHIAHELRTAKKPMLRVEFHEITKKGVQQGLSNPRQVDARRFNAQQARRILDRLIGYELSPVLWKRLCRQVNGHYLSAGRVQSAALRLIVDREDEIQSFVPQEYWPVGVELLGKGKPSFRATLIETAGKRVVTPSRDRVLKAGERVLSRRQRRPGHRDRPPPRPVHRGQRGEEGAPPPGAAAVHHQLAPARRREPPGLQRLAHDAGGQRLYEGIDVGAEGPVGLITYMRTDSTRMSTDSVDGARGRTSPSASVRSSSPTSPTPSRRSRRRRTPTRPSARPIDYHPDAVKKSLKPDEFKVYKLIWERFVACQMADAVYDQTTAMLEAAGREEAPAARVGAGAEVRRLARGSGRQRGAEEVAGEESVRDVADDAEGADESRDRVPMLDKGEALSGGRPAGRAHGAEVHAAVARYNEGSLVKALEDLGIGRPSTYAEIVTKVLSATTWRSSDKQLVPTKLGTTKTHGLAARFPTSWTTSSPPDRARPRRVEVGTEADWVKLVDRIYKPFKQIVVDLEKNAKEPGEGWPRPEPSDRICDKCGAPMVVAGAQQQLLRLHGVPQVQEHRRRKPRAPAGGVRGQGLPEVRPRPAREDPPRLGRAVPVVFGLAQEGAALRLHLPDALGHRVPQVRPRRAREGRRREGPPPFWGCTNYRSEKAPEVIAVEAAPEAKPKAKSKTKADKAAEKDKAVDKTADKAAEKGSGCDFRVYFPPVKEPCPKCGAKFLVLAGGKTRPVIKCVAEGCGYERAQEPDADESEAESAA
jgi:DNA topoisomerase-1